MSSHPVWVRGLKLAFSISSYILSPVAPRVGAWIETLRYTRVAGGQGSSHPVWVRGLKPLFLEGFPDQPIVAPRVGAWIETLMGGNYNFVLLVSHPVWVRGLKLGPAKREQVSVPDSRTPCGCVD